MTQENLYTKNQIFPKSITFRLWPSPIDTGRKLNVHYVRSIYVLMSKRSTQPAIFNSGCLLSPAPIWLFALTHISCSSMWSKELHYHLPSNQFLIKIHIPKAVARRCSMILEISQNLQENTKFLRTPFLTGQLPWLLLTSQHDSIKY